MKLLQNKFSESILLLPILVFIFIVLYYFYSSYAKYNTVNKSIIYSEYILKLNNLLNEDAKERGIVSVFLGTNGISDFKKLENQWQIVDASSADFNKFLSKHSEYKERTQDTLNSLSTMKDIRPNISILNISFKDLYMRKSNALLSNALLQHMDKNDLELDDNVKKMLDIYIAIVALKESAVSERALVSYFLSRSKAISIDELEVWDKYIGMDSIANYDKLTEDFTELELNNILKSTKHQELLENISLERKAILISVNSGEFSTSQSIWYKLQSSKIDALEKAQTVIYKTVKEDFAAQLNVEQKVMSISALLVALSIFLAFVIRNIFSSLARDREELGNVLKNIEFDDDIDFDIKGMIERQDKAEMYDFLEKTIRESRESKRFSDEANESKSQFLANMSHEVRTPLNGIVGFTDLLKETDLDEEQTEFIEVIEKSSENLLAVINDILDLSKIESNKIEIEEIPFDPIVEFESGIESYGAKASEKGINFGFYIDPTLIHQLRGDAVRIKQIIVNLISNAVKFTPDGGEIDVLIERIATRGDRATIRFSVKDSGIGITQEQQEKIFDAFTQADTSTNRKFGGTGLGLTISKTFVELMDGKLQLDSEIGSGTTFFFELTFEEIVTSNTQEMYNEINVGYYLPQLQIIKQSDKYIKEYINSLAKFYHLYDSIATLISLGIEDKPELLFIEYDYIKTEELVRLNSLGISIVLLTTLDKKDQVSEMGLSLYKVIYSPVNFTKIRKCMQTYHEANGVDSSLDTTQTNLKKTKTHKSLSHSQSADILLCRSEETDTNIYYTLLNKIGYSVDIAKNIDEIEDMVKAKKYEYVLLDSNLKNLAESGLAEYLLDMSVKSLLFIENKQSIGEKTKNCYTNIAIDVPQLQLLKHMMSKLIPLGR